MFLVRLFSINNGYFKLKERTLSMAESGRIRKKYYNFAAVSNEILRRRDVSLKAKGLYSLIQSFITIPDYVVYKSVLRDHYCGEGKSAFDSAWNELKKIGYLKQYRMKDEKNHFYYEYELLDTVETDVSSQKISSSISTRINSLKSPVSDFRVPGNPESEIPVSESPNPDKKDTNNIYTRKKNLKENYYQQNNDDEKFKQLCVQSMEKSSMIIDSADFNIPDFLEKNIPLEYYEKNYSAKAYFETEEKWMNYVENLWMEDQKKSFIDNLSVITDFFNEKVFDLKTYDFWEENSKYIKDYILEAINAMKNDKIKIFKINNFTSKKWFKIINKISMQLVDVEEKSVQNPIGYCYSIILNEI